MMETPKSALLVGVQLPRVSDQDVQASLTELERLVQTLGYPVVGRLSQKRSSTSSAVVVGEGKLKEIARWTGGTGVVNVSFTKKKSKAAARFHATEEEAAPEQDDELAEGAPPPAHADLLVFDVELTPSQLRNLESATGAKVLDRTGVIIEIFSRHARSRAARLQVEIARLNYLAPRLRETGGTSERLGGKGAGESSQELDRRHIRDRIKELKMELAIVQSEGAVRRQRREEENSVALVGYTNAGKSSLMRALTDSEVLVADKLFATLDTTVREMKPSGLPRVLLSDTVGFIKKLPHDLVASFRSTLEEAVSADLLLFVVDASDPEFGQQLAVTREVLGEIGALTIPSWLILNKKDRLSEDARAQVQRAYPDAILLSTRNGPDLDQLRDRLRAFFSEGMEDAELFVPYTVPGAIGEIRRRVQVLGEMHDERGTRFQVRAQTDALRRLRERFKI